MAQRRLFFALPPSAATAMQIADWRDRAMNCPGTAVPAANFHITLAFMGPVEEDKIEILCAAADEACDNSEPLCRSLSLNQIGYWPRPGILWLGPREWPATLTKLASRLRQTAASCGARRERNRFQPHVTLFRRCPSPPAMPAESPGIAFDIEGLTLFESRQGRNGVSYHPLCEWDLTDSHASNLL
ncbi:MAG: RNA 2',3'-cyclic phosphodiesterase [Halioglobus sp.]